MDKKRKSDYELDKLIDINSFKQILDNFFKATEIPNGLVDNNGKVIAESGWSDVCNNFHRKQPNSKKFCEESNLSLIQSLSKNSISKKKCKNGLIDYVAPVIVDNKVIAILFLGQFFNKSPNLDYFISQAEKYNYDETRYIDAIKKIPIVTDEKMKSLMLCIVEMIDVLVSESLSKKREDKLELNLKKTNKQSVELQDILDFSPLGIGWTNKDGEIEYVNHKFTELFGYTIEDIPTLMVWFIKAFPNKQYRENLIIPWNNKVIKSFNEKQQPPELEATITCKDGTNRRTLIRLSWIGEKRLSNFSDITIHWKNELRNRSHDNMLEMVAKGVDLKDILHNIIKTIELEDKTSICSILLLEDKKYLLIGSSPSLPAFFNEAINGVEIGVGVGSCGTAAYLKERVIVENIMEDECWKDYKDLAKKANLYSCWSEPIISSTGEVLGTFAIYHNKPTLPKEQDFERIKFASNLASIAIENRNARKELEHRAYFDFLTNLPNRRYYIEQSELEISRNHRFGGILSIIMFDIDHFKLLNDKYGHNVGDLVLKKIADISRTVLRDIDIIGRIGGEEFAISLPCTDVFEAEQIAQRLRIEIEKGEINLTKETLCDFTASFGVSTNSDNYNIQELLNFADIALYEAKSGGRNRVCIFRK
ncbi:diguanylate cyclase [Arcobacter sp.]|uniref:diguanylate cyclase n=1 Tax=unclassified Arcobacter TaxID=2593671 RepID=UPI003AFF9E62